MTDIVYLVMRTTGEYDDYFQWPVAGFVDRDEAVAHANDLTNKEVEIVRMTKLIMEATAQQWQQWRELPIEQQTPQHLSSMTADATHRVFGEFGIREDQRQYYLENIRLSPADYSVEEFPLLG